MKKINIYGIAYPVTALGPGSRVVLWVCGCKKRCPACISPEMQNYAPKNDLEVQILAHHLLRLKLPLDGLTISGGEPFDQALALSELLTALARERSSWNTIIYSGYKLSELRAGKAGETELLNHIDVLIDGSYRERIPSKHPLTGSGNQVIHFLTKRGKNLEAQIEALPPNHSNLGMGTDHRHMLIGILNPAARKTIHKDLQIKDLQSNLQD